VVNEKDQFSNIKKRIEISYCLYSNELLLSDMLYYFILRLQNYENEYIYKLVKLKIVKTTLKNFYFKLIMRTKNIIVQKIHLPFVQLNLLWESLLW
jgi:hypothetical protein